MPIINVTTEILAPIEKVFDLSRSIEVHELSQSSNNERAVAGRTSGLIEADESVTWEAVHFGIRQRLTSKVVEMTRPTYFRDSMVSGAFKRFDHDHLFEITESGSTRMTDVFDYTSPLGFLGRLADATFLRKYMVKLLEERNSEIKRIAEMNENEVNKPVK